MSLFKVVIISNFSNETRAEYLATSEGPITYNLENLDEPTAKAECKLWNEKNASDHSYGYAKVYPQDYVLWVWHGRHNRRTRCSTNGGIQSRIPSSKSI